MKLEISLTRSKSGKCGPGDSAAASADSALAVDEVAVARRNSFYSAAVGAWFTVRLEQDRGILTLSTIAIGLLVTMVGKVSASLPGLLLCGLAALAFVVAMVAVLIVYGRSADYLEEVVSTLEFSPAIEENNKLTTAERVARVAFGVGVVLTILTAGWTGILEYRKGDGQMAKDNQGGSGVAQDGFSGAHNLQRGFSNATNLVPKPAPAQPAATPAQPVASTPTATPASSNNNSGSSGNAK